MKRTDHIDVVDALRVYLVLCLDLQVHVGTCMRREMWLKAVVQILNRTSDLPWAAKRSVMETVTR